MTQPIRVLVVDDSAYIRKVIREMLSRSPAIEVVGTARDGDEALEQVELLNPDVVTCDLIMPGTDGVEFIRRQMAIRPVPIVIVSIAAESSERALNGLDAGAFDSRAETDRLGHGQGLRCCRRTRRQGYCGRWGSTSAATGPRNCDAAPCQVHLSGPLQYSGDRGFDRPARRA
jgi:CheY-like chemotaxis protein